MSEKRVMQVAPCPYVCYIVENKKLNGSTFAINVECGGPAPASGDRLATSGGLALEARAGQFLHIDCGEGLLLRRPISICSVRGAKLTFVFEVKGEGTRRLSKALPGQKLDILGPLGNGFSFPDGDIIVVGGGIGAPPMLFAAESAKSRATAVLGFRDSGGIILKEEFEAACDKVIVATDDGSYGFHGTVLGPLAELLQGGGFEAVMACGPRPMLRAVARLCGERGVPCQVSLEEYMACGVGACLVCACATVKGGVDRMSRVCRDGPVFDAREVVWGD